MNKARRTSISKVIDKLKNYCVEIDHILDEGIEEYKELEDEHVQDLVICKRAEMNNDNLDDAIWNIKAATEHLENIYWEESL